MNMRKMMYWVLVAILTHSPATLLTSVNELSPERLRPLLVSKVRQKQAAEERQLRLDFG